MKKPAQETTARFRYFRFVWPKAHEHEHKSRSDLARLLISYGIAPSLYHAHALVLRGVSEAEMAMSMERVCELNLDLDIEEVLE